MNNNFKQQYSWILKFSPSFYFQRCLHQHKVTSYKVNDNLAAINGNMTVVPSTIKAIATYSFTIDTSTIIPSGGMLTLQFPPEVVLPSNPQVFPQFGFSGSPQYSVSGNILKIVGGFPSLNGIRFRILNIVNPGSALNLEGFTFKFYSSTSSSTPIDSSQQSSGFFFQYSTDTLIGGNIVPASYIVGEYCTWSLQITPKNGIPAGGILRLFMPKWIDSTQHSITPLSMLPSGSNTCAAGSGLSSSSMSCTFYRDPSPTARDYLTINNAFSSALAGNNFFEIKISNFRNMPTTRPYSNFEIWTYDANGYGIDNLKAIEVGMLTPATLPAKMASVIIEAPTTVDALTTYLFQIFVQNPIPMGGTIRIRIPPTIGASQLTAIISKQRLNLNVQRTYPVLSDTNLIELTGGFPTLAESVPLSAVVAFQLFKLKNPSTPSQTTSFEITTYETYQGQQYPIETITTGLQVAGSSGKITMNSNTNSETRVLEYNSFTFDMVLQNALSPGCSVQIQFPSEFLIPDVATGSCRLIGVFGISSSATCQFVQNKMIIQDPFGSADSKGMDNIRFTIANNYVRNPTSTRPTTTGIVIKSMSANGNPIDDWSGNKFTATENALQSVTVTPFSYVAGDYPVTYQFTIRTPYQVEANAFIYIKFPTGDLSVYDTSIAADKCLAVATLSQSNIKCSAKETELTITKGFPSGICACQGDITFTVGGIINPRSLKTTKTFMVSILSNDNYLIYSKKTGITLKMMETDRQTTVSISQVLAQNGAKDQYIFAVKNHNEIVDGDIINIYFPPEISISNDTSCGARFGVRGFYKCSQDKIKTNVMSVSLAFSQRILAPSSIGRGYEFLLTNIQNAPSMAPTSQFTILINDVDGFNISTITNGLIVANKKSSNMTSVAIKPSIYSDGKWTNLTFSVIPKNYMQFMTMTIQIPPDVLIAQAAPNLCQVISSYSISKEMVCDYQPGTRTIRILNGFQQLTKTQFDLSSILLRTLQFMIGQFINPIGVTKSGDFIFTTYDRQGYIIDQLKQPISYVCSPLCGACSNDDYTKCISCPSNSTFKFLYLGQCVQSCPTGTTEQKNKCLVCSSGCQECSSENDTCISCAKNFFTLQGACVGSCPSPYTVELPNKCVSPVIPVFRFISYFQKRNDYQCYMFPLSAASILITIVMWIAVCCSKCLVSRQRERLIQQEIKPHGFLTPLRLVEICISLISILELGGWGFFLYCMLDLQEKLPFYIICGALGLNLFLNFVMTCGIMRSKSNYDRYVQKYQDTYSCSYRIIQCFSLLVSHKWFYISFTRYQRNRNRPSQFDFSYFDSGDEDGVSGICFKFFFLASVLLLHGAVIAACVLNFLNNDLTKKLFCLDLDIIGMTGFQALLILLTLLQCGTVPKQPQRVFPLDNDLDGKKKLNQTSAKSIDVDEDEEDQKSPKRDKKGRIIPEEKIKNSKKKGSNKDVDEENPFSKKTKRGKDDDPDFTRNLDRTIDPLDEDEIQKRPRGSKKAQNNYVSKGKDSSDIDDGFQTIDHRQKSKKRGGQQNEESDSAEDITNSIQKKKKKQNKNGDRQEDSDDSYDVQGPNNAKNSKKKKNKRGKEAEEEESEEDSEYDNRGNKIQKNKKQKKPKKKFTNGQNQVSDEESQEESQASQENANKPKKNKQKKKKLVKNDKGKFIEIEETDSDEESDSDFQQPGSKNQKKPKKQKKKKLIKNAKGQMIEVQDSDSEEEIDQQSSDGQQIAGSKKSKKPKKQKTKKLVKNAKGQMVEVTESSDESEQDDSDDDQTIGKSAKKQKKKKPKKKKVKNEKGQIIEVTDSETPSEEEEEDSDDQQPGKQQKTKKKREKKPKKIKVKNEKGQIIEVTASNESIDETEDDDQPEQSKNKKLKQIKKGKKKVSKQGGNTNQDESEESSEEEVDDPSIPPSQRKQKKKKPMKKKKKIVNKDGTISVIEEASEEEEIEVSEYYDDEVEPNNDQIPGVPGDKGKPKAAKKKKKKLVKKKRNADTKELNYEEVSHSATSDDELGQQKGIKFDKVRVDKEMQKLHDNIADGDEPSYRELVDQINHEEGRREPILTTETIRNPSAKFGTIFKDTKQQDEVQHQERVSAKFGIVHNSIPTEHDEEHIERNNADFAHIKSSYPTQYDEKFLESTQPLVFEQDDDQESPIKQGSQNIPSQSKKSLRQPKDNRNEHDSPSSSGSQQLEHNSKGQVEEKRNHQSEKLKKLKNNQVQNKNLNKKESNDSDIDQNDISESISSNQINEAPETNHLIDQKVKSPQKRTSSTPGEAQYQYLESKDKFKSPSMSLENNATQEQRSINNNKLASPNKKLQNQDQYQDTHEENEEEEKNDKVNQDDIKPKTKIIFSDKSESSVEDLMEDTPSNYNVLNGRLDEDSKGLRSVMYKAISKKALYQNILDKSSQNLQPGAEDHEARQISSNGVQKKSAGRPPSTSSSSKIKKREQAKLFIQKAENAGISTLNQGSNLLQQQIQMTQSVARHQRNASIGEITSSKLMDEDNNQLDPNNINKYASQMLIIPNTDTSANQK